VTNDARLALVGNLCNLDKHQGQGHQESGNFRKSRSGICPLRHGNNFGWLADGHAAEKFRSVAAVVI
jgi:hypothetical protein